LFMRYFSKNYHLNSFLFNLADSHVIAGLSRFESLI
jgi:hypothetical protein